MARDFAALDTWLADIFERVSPPRRRQIAAELARALRRANAARIAANVEPGGSAMEPRKPRQARRGKDKQDRVAKRGKMFPRLKLARNMKTEATPDSAKLEFRHQVVRTANVHHFGLRDRVARFRGAAEVRYPERPLFGFAPEDRDMAMEIILRGITK